MMKEMVHHLYKVTNTVNGTVYIGQTITRSISQRWDKHCNNSSNKSRRRHAMSSAIRKYGKEKFIVESLGFCLSQRAANIAERALISYWRSKGDTYNRSDGGNELGRGGWKLSKESKYRIRKNSRKQWTQPWYRRLMSKASKKRWDNFEYKKAVSKKISLGQKKRWSRYNADERARIGRSISMGRRGVV